MRNWLVFNSNETILYAIHQHSEKRIDIHCKVTFGFKYIYKLKATHPLSLYKVDTLALKAQSESTSGMSGGKAFQSGTSFFCLSYSWWCLMFYCEEELTFCPSWWQPALYLSCTACSGKHPSVCPAGFASLNPGACHSHLMCSGVCWWHNVQPAVVPSRPSEYIPGCKDHTLKLHIQREV